jgi:transcriptional regulator of acetoin/glycerol metabolism
MEHPSPIIDADDLRQARDRLLHEGVQHYQEASSPVREPILRSWRRSASEAVPTGRNAFRYLDPQGRSELLRRSASPVLDRLQTDLDGLGVAIFLSDHQGLILSRRAGSAAQRNTLDNACAAEGFDF